MIWVDEEAQETELVGERDHPATSPRVEELYVRVPCLRRRVLMWRGRYCCHPDSGWCVRVRNRGGVTYVLGVGRGGVADFWCRVNDVMHAM